METETYRAMQAYLKTVVSLAQSLPYELNQEAVLIGAKKALYACENRLSLLTIQEVPDGQPQAV